MLILHDWYLMWKSWSVGNAAVWNRKCCFENVTALHATRHDKENEDDDDDNDFIAFSLCVVSIGTRRTHHQGQNDCC